MVNKKEYEGLMKKALIVILAAGALFFSEFPYGSYVADMLFFILSLVLSVWVWIWGMRK